MVNIRVVAVGLVAIHATAALAHAQISGRLVDRAGAALPGATVIAESRALPDGPRSAVTQEDGEYDFVGLPPGTYDMTFTMPGFSSTARHDLDVAEDAPLTVNATLLPGILDVPIRISGPSPVTSHYRLVPGAAGFMQLCKPLPNGEVGRCLPVIASAAERANWGRILNDRPLP